MLFLIERNLKIIRTTRAIRREATAVRASGRTIVLVPTMGCLHEGHLSLIRRGRKVAGADLNSGKRLKLPSTLSFDISTDLGTLTGKSIGKGKIGDAKIGTVKFDINSGKMTFNGQRISGRTQAELSAKCKQVLSGR